MVRVHAPEPIIELLTGSFFNANNEVKLMSKYIFISYPYSSNPAKNRKAVDKVCRMWAKRGYIPLSPLHMFSFYENDKCRKEIMQVCFYLIRMADIVAVYGNKGGCKAEREFAEKLDKPVLMCNRYAEFRFFKQLMEDAKDIIL